MRASRPFFKKLEATNPRSQGKTPLEHRVRADQGSRLMKGKRQSAVAPLDLFARVLRTNSPFVFLSMCHARLSENTFYIGEHILYRSTHSV